MNNTQETAYPLHKRRFFRGDSLKSFLRFGVKNKICVNPHERNVFMDSGCVLPRVGYLIGSFAGVPAFLGYLEGVEPTFSIFTRDL